MTLLEGCCNSELPEVDAVKSRETPLKWSFYSAVRAFEMTLVFDSFDIL